MANTARILLIAPDFFGYAREIQAAFLRRGVELLWFDDRPASDTLSKALIRISPRLQRAKAERYFDGVIAQARLHPITDVLVIKGQALSGAAIARLKAALPAARFTLYFWDSYRNMSADSAAKVPLFERAFTFDPVDARADPRLTYQPLFYLDEYATLAQVEQDIDVLFCGTMHSDRYQVWSKLKRALPPGARVREILYFNSRLVYWARRVFDPSFWGARRAEFVFAPVAKRELQALLARTRVVVDIERPVQSGLTIRTIEAVGARKKLITTNAFARDSDIYTPENVLCIERAALHIPAAFFDSDFTPLAPAINAKYSLDGWLSAVLPHGWPKAAPVAAPIPIAETHDSR
jgi:hypothetical protein